MAQKKKNGKERMLIWMYDDILHDLLDKYNIGEDKDKKSQGNLYLVLIFAGNF